MKVAWHNDEWKKIIGERESEDGKELRLMRFQWWLPDEWVLESQIEQIDDLDFN